VCVCVCVFRPPELLSHELCETMMDGRGQLLFKGLRLKAGLEQGQEVAQLMPTTGRIAYKGKTLTRAQALCRHATCGQVCSSDN
jgi:hypothetical protein